jgi:Icc-related predicted phosphoesterase
MSTTARPVRVAAIADLHCKREPPQGLRQLFEQISDRADVLALCGDLTDYGLREEAEALAKELLALKVPIVAVLGNHDYESGRAHEVRQVLSEVGVRVLDGEACEIEGVGFGGAKGFAGGFGRRTLEPWGEQAIKHFVQEALDETLKLESALARLRTRERIALMHYAPIQQTVEGEPLEIYPFLGSSRMEEPLNRYQVRAAFHGHAHRGAPEGKTAGGIPVYNVSWQLLQSHFSDQHFRIIEVPRE